MRDRIGNDAVDADTGEDQRDSAEDAKQYGRNAPAAHACALDLIERPNVGDRLILVHAADRLDNRNLQGERVNIGADIQDHAVNRTLLVRDVDTGAAIVCRAAYLLVTNHADDFPGHVRPELRLAGDDLLNEQTLTDRIFLVEVALRQTLVHHQRARRVPRVAIGQRPSLLHLDAERREIRRTDHLEEAA